jgi:hypothetical protein
MPVSQATKVTPDPVLIHIAEVSAGASKQAATRATYDRAT